MKTLIRLLQWTLKAAVFFTLFAFALNNTQETDVQFFFGYAWTAPLVLVVLAAFTAGVAIGVLGMVPRWWRHKRRAQQLRAQAATGAVTVGAATAGAVYVGILNAMNSEAAYDPTTLTSASKTLK